MIGGVDGAELRFVSLYSGCGGLDLGFARAGMRPVWANDIDAHAVETYNKISKVTDPQWRDAARSSRGTPPSPGTCEALLASWRRGWRTW